MTTTGTNPDDAATLAFEAKMDEITDNDTNTLRRLINSPISTTDTRAAFRAEVIATYGDNGHDYTESVDLWVLAERNVHPGGDGCVFLTSHTSAAAAVRYHREQPSVEDWQVVELVDLARTERHEGESHPAWSAGKTVVTPDDNAPASTETPIRTWGDAAAATADLPPGTIVAGRHDVYIREEDPDAGGLGVWRCTRTSHVYGDEHIDNIRQRGARVVRHGYDGILGALPVTAAQIRLRSLLDALLTAAAEEEFDPDTSVRDEIIARYAAHETDPVPSRAQLADMLDAVDEEQEPYDPEGARVGSAYDNGWHDAVAAIRDLADRYPDGLRTPHAEAGQPLRGPDGQVMPGFVVAWCGHRIAGQEWRAGYRTCERDPKDGFRQPIKQPTMTEAATDGQVDAPRLPADAIAPQVGDGGWRRCALWTSDIGHIDHDWTALKGAWLGDYQLARDVRFRCGGYPG